MFFFLPLVLFIIGVIGFFFSYRNILLTIMCLEILLLAINLNFLLFSHLLDDCMTYVFSILFLSVAGAESALGLAIVIMYYKLTL